MPVNANRRCPAEEDLWSSSQRQRLRRVQANQSAAASLIQLSFTRTPHPRSHCHPSFPAYATPNTSTSNGRPGRRSDRLPYLLFDIVGNAAAIPRVTALRLNASLALLVRQEGSGGGGSWALSCPTGGAGRGDRQEIAGLRGRKGGKSKVSQSSRRFRDAGKEARNKKSKVNRSGLRAQL